MEVELGRDEEVDEAVERGVDGRPPIPRPRAEGGALVKGDGEDGTAPLGLELVTVFVLVFVFEFAPREV